MPSTAPGPKLSGMNYQVQSILHTDATGTVMLIADQGAMGRRHALKIVRRDGPESDPHIDLCRAAFEASQKLDHPSLLKYHDFQLKKKWFRVDRAELLMEYADGKSLDALPDLSLDSLILIFRHVAAGLSHLHRRGVRHGDLRPEHVMLTKGGAVKVLGFGWSRLDPKHREALRPSKRYAAPEAIRGKVVSDRADVYALGALMYHQMTGQPANRGARSKGDVEKISTPARLNPAISDPLNNLLIACLQSDPPRRPERMYEVHQRLDALARDQGLDDGELKGLAAAPEV